MKITIIGATGFVGSAILKEVASRNHEITAISLSSKENKANVIWKKVDVNNVEELSKIVSGQDLVISAFNAGWTNPNLYNDFLAGSKSIQNAVKKSGVKRLIIIGGAGSLFVTPNLQVVDTPDFPKEYYKGASAARDYLNIIKEENDLHWVFFSPALEMHPGITTGRTGKYRLGLENPVLDENGRGILSVEDVAVAIVDEAENQKHHQIRFTAAY